MGSRDFLIVGNANQDLESFLRKEIQQRQEKLDCFREQITTEEAIIHSLMKVLENLGAIQVGVLGEVARDSKFTKEKYHGMSRVAIIEDILRESDHPMESREIANRALEGGWENDAKYPQKSIQSAIRIHSDKFEQIAPGRYRLRGERKSNRRSSNGRWTNTSPIDLTLQ